MHSTNYTNTFIEAADDYKAGVGTVLAEKKEKTVTQMQFELPHAHPTATPPTSK